MGKPFFTFCDRAVPVQFFENEPVKVTLIISDKTDQRILDCYRAFAEADKLPPEKRLAGYEDALRTFLGRENADRLLSRMEECDCFAVTEVFTYILTEYREAKTKKLNGSAR